MPLPYRPRWRSILLTTGLLCGCLQGDSGGDATDDPAVSMPEVIDPPSDLDAPYRDPWHVALAEAEIVEKGYFACV